MTSRLSRLSRLSVSAPGPIAPPDSQTPLTQRHAKVEASRLSTVVGWNENAPALSTPAFPRGLLGRIPVTLWCDNAPAAISSLRSSGLELPAVLPPPNPRRQARSLGRAPPQRIRQPQTRRPERRGRRPVQARRRRRQRSGCGPRGEVPRLEEIKRKARWSFARPGPPTGFLRRRGERLTELLGGALGSRVAYGHPWAKLLELFLLEPGSGGTRLRCQ